MPYRWLPALLCGGGLLLYAGAPEDDLAEAAQRARQAMLAKRYLQAVDIYKKMLRSLPGEPGLHLNLALALHSSARYRESVHELESIRDAEQSNANFWFLLGMDYLKLKAPLRAVEPLQKAHNLDPSNLDTRVELAGAFLEAGSLHSAQQAFEQLAADHPELPKAWEGLAISQLNLSRSAFEALEAAAPDSSFRYGLAAVAEADAGNTDKAMAFYQRAISAAPPAPWLAGELEALRHSPAPALECTDQSFACRFSRGDWVRLAESGEKLHTPEVLYWACRSYAQLARQAIEKLAGLPSSPEQHQMLARAYTQAGRRTEAISELREALRLGGGAPLIQAQLAKALWVDRKFPEATEILDSLVASNPEEPEWQFELGDALFNLGRPEESLPHLQKAVTLDPQLLPAQAKLGEALLRAGNAAAALPHLERSQTLDRDGSLHYQLALAYRRVGKPDLAAQAMARRKQIRESIKDLSN